MTKFSRLRRCLEPAFGLTAALVLASCSQTGRASSTPTSAPPSTSPTSATSATSSSSVTSPTSSAPATRRIDITVKGKQVRPAPALVNIAVGELLTIAVTSDHDDTLHAHEFKVERAIKAGQTMEITVKGTRPGVFEIELHHPELRLFQVAVR